MDIYAFANQKGGVGKTTITLGVAAALVGRGARVLLIDLDPQASATKGARTDSGA
ncbi:MAG: chromosome partitioning protein [Solirubrobacterales bacterium]|nr:chromosome partitioning protein [Solirubrobacterales bacterium]